MENNYKELLLFPEALKDKTMYPDTVRKLVSEACGDKAVHPGIFNRYIVEEGDDAGKRKTVHRKFGDDRNGDGFGATPSIVFGGGRGIIRIYGIGKRGIELLEAEALKIVQNIVELLGNSVFRFEFKEGKCSIAQRYDPVVYRIHNLCLTKDMDEVNLKYMDAKRKLLDIQDVAPHICKVLYRGIVGQAMGLDDEDGTFIESLLPHEDGFDAHILDGTLKIGCIKEHANGKKVHALFAHGLVFGAPYEFKGPWFTGHLRSHGHGAIRKHIAR
jgi:hypothetical protein